jgi:hypothetical protein
MNDSDDLDFFVNDDSRFPEYARRFEEALRSAGSETTWHIERMSAVMRWHPDRLCDQVSDTVHDARNRDGYAA